jgi:hypothetical protein
MLQFRWNQWNIEHIAEHGISPAEAQAVVRRPARGYPRRTGNDSYLARGQTEAGHYLQVCLSNRPAAGIDYICDSCPPAERCGKAPVLSKMRKPMKPQKPYWEMTTAELREATKEFDAEFVPTRPLTPAMKARLRRARMKRPGRPKVGKGSRAVMVSMEESLLNKADALAKKQKISRSELIARGLRILLKAG